jgi:hypothetical protein
VVERAAEPFVQAALEDTDRRVGEGKPVAPSFLLACVLWSDVREGWAQRQKQQHAHPALQDAIDDVFNARIGDVSGRGKLAADMREIWMMQPRFDKRVGSAPFGLVDQPRFRAGFDFMRLRADVAEVEEVLADWWEDFSRPMTSCARTWWIRCARSSRVSAHARLCAARTAPPHLAMGERQMARQIRAMRPRTRAVPHRRSAAAGAVLAPASPATARPTRKSDHGPTRRGARLCGAGCQSGRCACRRTTGAA